jgi:diguanylate cyclase (GGDEF)-like protein
MNTPPTYRVLVIDDNHAIHDDIRKILAEDEHVDADTASLEDAIFGESAPAAKADAIFKVVSAFQGQEGFARAEAARKDGKPYALAFVDMRMPPGWDGKRTVEEIWRCDPDLNIVICTAFSDHSWDEIESLDQAGDRLLVLKKPFEPIEVRRLAATLTAKSELAQQAKLKMTELEGLVSVRTQELHTTATHDRLTGLPNRALFYERLTHALARRPEQGPANSAVLFLDFDRFKVVNDSLGHAGGDQLLQTIARRMTAAMEAIDTPATGRLLARLGGDEFCVLLSGMADPVADASLVATRLLEALAAPYEVLGCRVQSTASIGLAICAPHYQTADEVVRDADTAMYRAKVQGKGRFVVFDASMHEQAMKRLTIEMELRRALSCGELEVYYQPVVDTATTRPTGAEALVRWRHPTRGMVSPADFIPIAEESGLICELGLTVLEQSARQIATWAQTYPDVPLTVSVNVSTKQLARPTFVAEAAAIIASSGVNPQSLILEITESALIGDTALARRSIQALQDLGVRIYLDDFGTGYSSLNLLHTFELDGLKIDRSFVQEATGARKVAAIIHSVTELANHLEMDIVAEGIETPEQLALLQRFRCQKVQGYLFSKPITAVAFEELVLVNRTAFKVGLSIAA